MRACFAPALLALSACANMGSPDGGWYDETPPRIVGSTPADKSVNVSTRKIVINFDEYIKLNNATENVAVSPPQLEMPEVKEGGKRIIVNLKDTLKPNTTYTIDFSDAISDNNEGNPLGNYTFSFSTGDHIDTLEIAGNVIEAENLDPVKGIIVGLYPASGKEFPDSTDALNKAAAASGWNDSIFRTRALLRAARTNDVGHFVIKGVAPGAYKVFALQDADGDYRFSSKSEKIAFLEDVFVPTHKPDVRQDTIWSDSVHIRSITPVNYTHFLPDDLVLRAFTEEQDSRYLLKTERKQANRLDIYFNGGHSELPQIEGFNFNADSAFVVEHSLKNDTIFYWLRDTALVNQDTLNFRLGYYATDTLGQLQPVNDTLEVVSREPYAKRLKQQAKDYEDWLKEQKKAADKDEPYDTVMPPQTLKANWTVANEIAPNENPTVEIPTPLEAYDISKIHLYSNIDSTWYEAPFELVQDETSPRRFMLRGEWRPGIEYSLETDSDAFRDIYGLCSTPYKKGFGVKSLDQFSTLNFTFTGMGGKHIVAQLIDQGGNVIKEEATDNGVVNFFYINPGTYYIKMFVDDNNNGKWDTGDYEKRRQPEAVYYYNKPVECKEKWDVALSWNPKSAPPLGGKPGELMQQKAESKKTTIKNRNAERAKKLGIEYVQGVTGL